MKVKCRCRCHVDPNYKHVKACCVNGYVEMPDFKADNYPDITPPTTEEAELLKDKIQDIIRKNIKTCILDGGEMKTSEEKIGLMGEYNAATEILELLRRRSEQKTELPIEELKKIFAGYINWCGNGLKPDLIQLDNLFRYLTKSGCVLTRNGFKWESEQNSEAIEFSDWIARNHYYKDVHEEWYGCLRGMTVLIAKTTAELFQLFKKQ